jgi:serpin B
LGDGNTYTVQWFERARLELHPENEPPYHVLPGLLGVQVWQMQNDIAAPQSIEEEPSMHSPFVRANTRFAFTFFTTLQEQKDQQNMFISPISLAYALAMTYNGAVGDTQQAMAQVLNVQEMELDEVNQSFADLMQTLETADPDVQLAIANSLWARQDIAFEEDFLQRNRQFYEAEVERLDFNDPSAVETINGWVKEQTNDKIPTIVNELDPLTIMVLINAIYFKGAWSEEFDPENTSDRAFTLPDGSTKQVPMMEQDEKFPYYEGEGFQAISLPYGEERLQMSIFLPDEKSSLTDFSQQLNAQNWATWMQQLRKRDGVIVLPRFKLEDEYDLQQTLSDMGMTVAFACGQADFSRLYAEEDVCITKVKQKTFIEVNEEGTEAAAATSVEVGLTAAMPEEPFSMIVDRPFFFAIHDTQTGAILFLGSIVDPSE